MNHADIIGAGLAGLAAALSLVDAGWSVTLHEAGPAAGGRCRSYFDRELGCRIDNGNHLLLSGNTAAMAFLRQVRAENTLTGPAQPVFPFMDLQSGARWTLRPNQGRIPWWLFSRARAVPGVRLWHYTALNRLMHASEDATVTDIIRPGPLYDRLIEPLAIAALNTMPDVGSAKLLGAVMADSLGKGGAATIPRIPKLGLSESFIDPAVAWLSNRGAVVRTGQRIAKLRIEGGVVTALEGPEGLVPVRGALVLATPAPVAATLLPELAVPTAFESIVNLHFRTDADAGEAGFMGLLNSLAEWVFVRPGVVSVTISAANRWASRSNGDISATVWQEICRALNLSANVAPGNAMADLVPPYRILREKRATFAATPEQDRLRPPTRTELPNLVLAGDWTRTGLPATIEGAIRSGRQAAQALLETR